MVKSTNYDIISRQCKNTYQSSWLLDNRIETLIHFTFAFQSVCFTQEADEPSDGIGEKRGEDIRIKVYTLLVQVSCWTLLDEPSTYINTFAQSRCSCQSDNCIGPRTSILKEVNKNFPYFWVIRSGTGLGYPFAYQPCYAPFDNRIATSILRSMQKSLRKKKTLTLDWRPLPLIRVYVLATHWMESPPSF